VANGGLGIPLAHRLSFHRPLELPCFLSLGARPREGSPERRFAPSVASFPSGSHSTGRTCPVRPQSSETATIACPAYCSCLPVSLFPSYGSGLPCPRCGSAYPLSPPLRLWSASLALPVGQVVRPRLTPASRSASVSRCPVLLHRVPQVSRGKCRDFLRVDAGFIKHNPCSRWRTSQSRASSSELYHTLYPVLVHRPALLRWAPFRPRLTAAALSLSLTLRFCYLPG